MHYRRYWHRYKARIVPLSILFVLFYLIAVRAIGRNPFVSSDGFDPGEIQRALDQHAQLAEHYQLTGIVLHWQRLSGVQQLLRTMLDFDDVFAHIIVWNNNPASNLTFADLLIENSDRVEIVNSDENIKDLAKYRACELAKTRACFYADDDWDVRMYVRSLYSSFLLEPTILHAITDQFTYFTNLMWTFFDETIDLHTGFSWIGCGAVFSRENAVRHLKYLQMFLDNEENQGKASSLEYLRLGITSFGIDMVRQGDQFFAVWMNQFPAQFNGRMLHSEEGAMSSFENYDFDSIQHRASVLSITILERTLRSSPHSTLFTRQRASNPLVTYTKSPCSYNDRFLFFTNCLPLENLELIPFNISSDSQRGTRDNLPNTPTNPYTSDQAFFSSFSTANAVDDDVQTCWKISRSIVRGDLFGVDFHKIQSHGDLSFAIEYRHSRSLQKRLQIAVSLDSRTWRTLPAGNRSGIIFKKRRKLVQLRTRAFPAGFQVFRFIRFKALADGDEPFHICEIRLIP